MDFKKYYKYDELIKWVKILVKTYPGLSELKKIGKSYEGRDIFLVEITNKRTGQALEKPGFWLDGNIHAGEVTASTANLYFIWYLLTNYGQDPYVTDLIDQRVFYVVPRTNPDGAEFYLNTPYTLRSSVRPHPYSKEEWTEQEGLYPEDINGDGWITQMRIEDPEGEWKTSNKDPRQMIKRKSEDEEGTFYRIYPEGLILNWDGGEIKTAPDRWGLDLCRNFPADFTPSPFLVKGTTLYPGREPEVKAHLEFAVEHPNICQVQAGHTHGGFVYRPFCAFPDSEFIWREEIGGHKFSTEGDLIYYQFLEKRCEEICTYPMFTPFQGYKNSKKRDPKHPSRGSQITWWYQHYGAYAYTVEYWDLAEHVGFGSLVEREGKTVSWDEEENGLRLLQWNDKELGGEYFIPWQRFEHPQLGVIEIGGWKHKFLFQNPPPKFLESEIAKINKFLLYIASLTPLVKITKVDTKKIDEYTYSITAFIENTGFLPTYVTERNKTNYRSKPVVSWINVGDEAELLSGKKRQIIGDLEGKSIKELPRLMLSPTLQKNTMKQVSWVVKVKKNKNVFVTIESISEKGGTDRKSIKLN